MTKDFPKGTSDIPSKENYPSKISSKNLIGFERGISYLMETEEIHDDITLTGDVTGSGPLGSPVSTLIANKNITLTGDINGFGLLGGNIATTIPNKNIDLTGEVTGSGTLGSSFNTTIANKNITLAGEVTGTGDLGTTLTTTIPNKTITLTGDVTGSGDLGTNITTTVINSVFCFARGTEGGGSQNISVGSVPFWVEFESYGASLIQIVGGGPAFTEISLAPGYVYEAIANISQKAYSNFGTGGESFSGVEFGWKRGSFPQVISGFRGRTSVNAGGSGYAEISSVPAITSFALTTSDTLKLEITFLEDAATRETRGFSNFTVRVIGKL